MGGDNGQVFLGCRFPADPAYAATIALHATNIGVLLAKAGVHGRASVDFAATRHAGDRWKVHALEVNLRKGGTTHPYSTLRNLVPGRYDPASAPGSPTATSSLAPTRAPTTSATRHSSGRCR